jgi:hypothetical protein
MINNVEHLLGCLLKLTLQIRKGHIRLRRLYHNLFIDGLASNAIK